MALIDIKVPDIGDFKDVAVIELLVKPGDTVKAEQSLVTVESDKASMEIPSSHAGVVKERQKLKIGDTVNEGSVLLSLEAAGAAGAAPASAPAAAAPAKAAPAAAPTSGSGRGRASGVELRGRRRPRVRCAGARRRPRRLLGGLPRRRPRHEDGARRALCDARRRLPERRLHPVQGAAARGRGDGRGEALSRRWASPSRRRRSTWPS